VKQRSLDPAGYLSTKTISALCTPVGGAICMVRISGDQAIQMGEKLARISFSTADARKAKRAFLHDQNGKKLDDAVVIPFFGPNSFTGEDVVELFLHGSPMVAQRVLDVIFDLGGRLALPGEFSFRAVKNGKLQLSQAEAIKELVKAENDFALDLALEKLSGSQHVLIEKIRADLMQLTMLSEVGIDFSDQDIDEVSLPRLKIRLDAAIALLESLRGSFDRGKRFNDGVPVSIFGLPNAGKSSFFNALLGEDRSIVSATAGTTRDVVREKLSLKGDQGYVSFKISDTAGLRKSQDQIEEIGIERSLKAARESDLILVTIDGENPALDEVKKFLAQINLDTKLLLGVLTKEDLLNPTQKDALLKEVAELPVPHWVMVSSKSGFGMEPLAYEMASLGEKKLARSPGEVVLTQFEHVQAVERSLDCLNRAKLAFDLVLFATDIRHGMNELGPLIGETMPDDVLGKIFSDFCIGK
jgi:tRNA modification GTPase